MYIFIIKSYNIYL